MKLTEKIRKGARVTRRYEQAKTPYPRLLETGVLSAASQGQLADLYRSLNPAEIQREIGRIQKRLHALARLRQEHTEKEVIATEEFEYLSAEATIDQLEYLSR